MKNRLVTGIFLCLNLIGLHGCGGGGGSPAPAPAPVQPTPVPVPAGGYTVIGGVSELTSGGLVLRLGNETISVPANATSFAFSSKLAKNDVYFVRVETQPLGPTNCSVQNGVGEIANQNISNVQVVCRHVQAVATIFANVPSPTGIVFDSAGNLYVTSRNSIRKIDTHGVVTTYGVDRDSFGAYVDGAAAVARFNAPMGLAVDKADNVYVADSGNNVIRKISPDGIVSTFAGSSVAGKLNGTGTAAMFNGPRGVAVDASGVVYVTDTLNYLLRKITPDGTVTILAGQYPTIGIVDGQGAQASFGAVEGIAVEPSGNIVLAESGGHVIRRVSPTGLVVTFSGKVTMDTYPDVDAVGPAARFHFPMALTVDAAGNIYVAEWNWIRKITPDGLVSTSSIIGTPGYVDGYRWPTPFNALRGIAVDSAGNLYVTEMNLGLVQKISDF